jgi:hypothetical protein
VLDSMRVAVRHALLHKNWRVFRWWYRFYIL